MLHIHVLKKKIDLTSISTLISRFSSFRRVALEACERDGTGYASARAKRTVPFGAIVNSLLLEALLSRRSLSRDGETLKMQPTIICNI